MLLSARAVVLSRALAWSTWDFILAPEYSAPAHGILCAGHRVAIVSGAALGLAVCTATKYSSTVFLNIWLNVVRICNDIDDVSFP